MLQITRIHHVSVLVTDVICSRRFYGEILGLKEIAKPRTFDFVVVWYDLGNQHLHLRLKERPDTVKLSTPLPHARISGKTASQSKKQRRYPALINFSSPTRTAIASK